VIGPAVETVPFSNLPCNGRLEGHITRSVEGTSRWESQTDESRSPSDIAPRPHARNSRIASTKALFVEGAAPVGIDTERAAVQAEFNAAVAEATTDYEAAIRGLEIEWRQADPSDRREIEREMAALECEHQAELAGIEADYAEELAGLDPEDDESAADYEDAVAEAVAEYEAERARIIAERDEAIAEVTAEYEEERQAILDEYDAAVAELTTP
jgi:hypothetical protein